MDINKIAKKMTKKEFLNNIIDKKCMKNITPYKILNGEWYV